MRVCVLSGSPKGNYSVSYQTVLYLQKRFPEDSFEMFNVGGRIKALEKDLSPALEAINFADMLLFCYPVYTFIVPYQLHRFIELLKASGAELSGKFAAQLSTSKHFFDVTAQRFIQENCLDLGLKQRGVEPRRFLRADFRPYCVSSSQAAYRLFRLAPKVRLFRCSSSQNQSLAL